MALEITDANFEEVIAEDMTYTSYDQESLHPHPSNQIQPLKYAQSADDYPSLDIPVSSPVNLEEELPHSFSNVDEDLNINEHRPRGVDHLHESTSTPISVQEPINQKKQGVKWFLFFLLILGGAWIYLYLL